MGAAALTATLAFRRCSGVAQVRMESGLVEESIVKP